MISDEEQVKKGELISDINNCINELDFRKQVLLFIHINEQLGQTVRDRTNVKKMTTELKKLMLNKDFYDKLDYYSKIIESDDGLYLLDETITYTETYDLKRHDKIRYIIKKYQIEIAEELGKVKSVLREEKYLGAEW